MDANWGHYPEAACRLLIHIIEGEAGCRYAAVHKTAAVVVDALRASATAAALFAHNARELLITRTVNEALTLKAQHADALLYGERGGVPPAGFDYGNSPQEAIHGRNKTIIFTTTTGASRLIQAHGANPLLMGSTINSASVVQYLTNRDIQEVVLIPAGLMNVPAFDAQEDWVAATYIAMNLIHSLASQNGIAWGRGYEQFTNFCKRIETEGVDFLFDTAPHAAKLKAINKQKDIRLCAQTNIFDTLPIVVKSSRSYTTVQDAFNPLVISGGFNE